MSNFTSEIKKELLSSVPQPLCCRKAAFSALLLTGGAIAAERIEFISENEKIAQYFLEMAESVYSIQFENKTSGLKREKDKFVYSYKGERLAQLRRIFESEGNGADIMRQRTEQNCCGVAYIKGAFLGSGSCTLPHGEGKTGYHLEIVFPSRETAEEFTELLLRFELIARIIARGDRYVVYFKSREAISDFLSMIGAEEALATLETVTAEREENNRENRVNNCYVGNTDKTATASAGQVWAIQRLTERGEIENLPVHLKKTAAARLEHPFMTLEELAQELGITKSCLNHRLRKILEIYHKTEEKYD